MIKKKDILKEFKKDIENGFVARTLILDNVSDINKNSRLKSYIQYNNVLYEVILSEYKEMNTILLKYKKCIDKF